MRKILILLAIFILLPIGGVHAQSTSNTPFKKFQWNNGLTISPQMLFIGALDLGIYSNVEIHPFQNPIAVLGGIDIRNKWLQIKMSNEGLDTKSLKTHYSTNFISYFGLGYSLISKKQERNTFYLTATPYYFTFKETVNTPFIKNTSKNSSLNFNFGITWSNTKTNKKGRTINTQFYIPIKGSHFLDEIRIMNFKIGWSIYKIGANKKEEID